MPEQNWLNSFYETFLMRDFFGYVVPGAVFLLGFCLETRKPLPINDWVALTLIGAAAYPTAIGLRILGTRILVLQRPTNGWFCRLWRADEGWLKRVYEDTPKNRLESLIDREVVFMHITGHMAMALFSLAIVDLITQRESLWKCFSERGSCEFILAKWVVWALIASGLLFLIGHYRHANQWEALRAFRREEGRRDTTQDRETRERNSSSPIRSIIILTRRRT